MKKSITFVIFSFLLSVPAIYARDCKIVEEIKADQGNTVWIKFASSDWYSLSGQKQVSMAEKAFILKTHICYENNSTSSMLYLTLPD